MKPSGTIKGVWIGRMLLLVILLLCGGLQSPDGARAGVEEDRAEGIAWLLSHQNGDGSWGTGGARVAATAEVLAALRHNGVAHGAIYSRGLAWLANANTDSVDSLARKIIALENAGIDTVELGLVAELNSLRIVSKRYTIPYQIWGAYAGYQASHPDFALGMEALRAAGSRTSGDVNAYYNFALASQGTTTYAGWSFTGDSLGKNQPQKIFPTTHNIIALSSVQKDGSNVSPLITKAVNWLLISKKQADGSFLDNPSVTTGVAQQTALAYLAIDAAAAANIKPAGYNTALANAQAFLLTRQLSDGSWDRDPYQTALVLRTFAATAMIDGDGDGLPDAVENLLGTNPAQVDGRNLISGNGLTGSGMHVAQSSSKNSQILRSPSRRRLPAASPPIHGHSLPERFPRM